MNHCGPGIQTLGSGVLRAGLTLHMREAHQNEFPDARSLGRLQKVLDMPGMSGKNVKGVPVRTKKQVEEFTIKVEARQENGQPVIRVEDEVVDQANLTKTLSRYVNKTRKTELLLDASDDMDWGTIVTIQDSARGAGVSKVNLLKRP